MSKLNIKDVNKEIDQVYDWLNKRQKGYNRRYREERIEYNLENLGINPRDLKLTKYSNEQKIAKAHEIAMDILTHPSDYNINLLDEKGTPYSKWTTKKDIRNLDELLSERNKVKQARYEVFTGELQKKYLFKRKGIDYIKEDRGDLIDSPDVTPILYTLPNGKILGGKGLKEREKKLMLRQEIRSYEGMKSAALNFGQRSTKEMNEQLRANFILGIHNISPSLDEEGQKLINKIEEMNMAEFIHLFYTSDNFKLDSTFLYSPIDVKNKIQGILTNIEWYESKDNIEENKKFWQKLKKAKLV